MNIIDKTKEKYQQNKNKKLINTVFILSLLDITTTIIWSYIFWNKIDESIYKWFELLEWNNLFNWDIYLFILIKLSFLIYIHFRFIYNKDFFNKKYNLIWVYILILTYLYFFINNLYVIYTIYNLK